MNVLFVTSEVAPYSKTGGLADVSASLPAALTALGHRLFVVTPAYRSIWRAGRSIETRDMAYEVPVGGRPAPGGLLEGRLADNATPVYFVRQDAYYDRDHLYGENGRDYRDNCERFVFFCRAALEIIRLLELPVDVVHCNDWQTGLIPAYLKIDYARSPGYERIAPLLTIHNLAYQGRFWHWDMLLTGLDWRYFNWRQMEYYGQLNFLKTGIVFADAITTVSPTYAEEIQTPEHGCGLEGVLRQRRQALYGIMNGVDYAVWNPAKDPHLAARYEAASWREGKRACKAALQQELGLAQRADVPLVGMVGRLADQKGWDLAADVLQRWAPARDVQWAILGTGDPKYHKLLARLAASRPDRVGARLEFSDPLAHRIEAGADLFLMPSRYEPCGLNQLYSLKYGTPPVVRATGGLADSITHATPETLAAGTANGFRFEAYDARALEETLDQACRMWREQPEDWARLVQIGMNQDWSWTRSARQYAELYEKLAAGRW